MERGDLMIGGQCKKALKWQGRPSQLIIRIDRSLELINETLNSVLDVSASPAQSEEFGEYLELLQLPNIVNKLLEEKDAIVGIIIGLPGSGKSLIAKVISNVFRVHLIDIECFLYQEGESVIFDREKFQETVGVSMRKYQVTLIEAVTCPKEICPDFVIKVDTPENVCTRRIAVRDLEPTKVVNFGEINQAHLRFFNFNGSQPDIVIKNNDKSLQGQVKGEEVDPDNFVLARRRICGDISTQKAYKLNLCDFQWLGLQIAEMAQSAGLPAIQRDYRIFSPVDSVVAGAFIVIKQVALNNKLSSAFITIRQYRKGIEIIINAPFIPKAFDANDFKTLLNYFPEVLITIGEKIQYLRMVYLDREKDNIEDIINSRCSGVRYALVFPSYVANNNMSGFLSPTVTVISSPVRKSVIDQQIDDLLYCAGRFYKKALNQTDVVSYKKAIVLYSKAIELSGQSHRDDIWKLYYYRGTCYFRLNMLAEAVLDYEKAVESKPRYFQAYYKLGKVYYQQERYENAAYAFEDALKCGSLYPIDPWVYHYLGDTYLRLESWDKVIMNYNKAIDSNICDASVYYGLGLAYYKKQDYEFAESNFTAALKHDARHILARANRGNARFKLTIYGEAISDYEDAIKLSFKQGLFCSWFYNNLATTYYQQGKLYYGKRQFFLAAVCFRKAMLLLPARFKDYYESHNFLQFPSQAYLEMELRWRQNLGILDTGILTSLSADLAGANFNQFALCSPVTKAVIDNAIDCLNRIVEIVKKIPNNAEEEFSEKIFMLKGYIVSLKRNLTEEVMKDLEKKFKELWKDLLFIAISEIAASCQAEEQEKILKKWGIPSLFFCLFFEPQIAIFLFEKAILIEMRGIIDEILDCLNRYLIIKESLEENHNLVCFIEGMVEDWQRVITNRENYLKAINRDTLASPIGKNRKEPSEDELRLWISRLLLDGWWVDLTNSEVRRNINDREKLTQIWESKIRLFSSFYGRDNIQNVKVVTKAIQIAKELDRNEGIEEFGYFSAIKEIRDSYWVEWHRQMSLDELRLIGKYGKVYNLAGYYTFESAGKYPAPQWKRKSAAFHNRGATDCEACLAFRVPSFFHEKGNYNVGVGLPHRGFERLPQGYIKDLINMQSYSKAELLETLEPMGELAQLDGASIDIPASLFMNRRLYRLEESDYLEGNIVEIEQILRRINQGIFICSPLCKNNQLTPPLFLKKISQLVRKNILNMTATAGSGHPGGSVSAAEIYVTLSLGRYADGTKIANRTPQDHRWHDRDRIVVSEGHIAPLVYAVLAKEGFIPEKELSTLRKLNSRLSGHTDWNCTPGVDALTGSLGMGLSNAAGMAVTAKIEGRSYKVFVIAGDGEEQEGQYGEAARHIARLGLDNLVLIINNNKAQIDGFTSEVDSADLVKLWKGYGWNVFEVDGHEPAEIRDTLDAARKVIGKPTVIIADTLKGKGVDFMEAKPTEYHGRALTQAELEPAINQIDKRIEDIDKEIKSCGFDPDIYKFIKKVKLTKAEKKQLSSNRRKRKKCVVPRRKKYSSGHKISTYTAFEKRIFQWAKKDRRIVFIFTDNSPPKEEFVNKFGYFSRENPRGRCFLLENVGQHLASFAAGFGYCQLVPVIFLSDEDIDAVNILKMEDQLRMNSQAKVPFILASKARRLSIAPSVMDVMPDISTLEPCDGQETNKLTDTAVKKAINKNMPSYIRLNESVIPVFGKDSSGKSAYVIRVSRGWDRLPDNKLVIVSSGRKVYEAVQASKQLDKQGIKTKVINVTRLGALGINFIDYLRPKSQIFVVYDGYEKCLWNTVSRRVVSYKKTKGSIVLSLADAGIKQIVDGVRGWVEESKLPARPKEEDLAAKKEFPAGMRLSRGVGLAVAAKMDNVRGKVIVLAGEKEEQEGQFAEAARIAAHHKLDNLWLVLQHSNPSQIKDIWQAYGWEVYEDKSALEEAKRSKTAKPVLIITPSIQELDERCLKQVDEEITVFENRAIYISKEIKSQIEHLQSKAKPGSLAPYTEYEVGKKVSIRNGFGKRLVAWGRADDRIVAMCADLTESTRIQEFANKFGIFSSQNRKGRFIPVGIREQAMAGMAAGLAEFGKIPIVATFDCFANRMMYQLKVIADNRLSVIAHFSHTGLGVGADGLTHHSVVVAAVFELFRNTAVFWPVDAQEAEKSVDVAMARAFERKGFSVVQTTRNNVPILTQTEISDTEKGVYVVRDSREQGRKSDVIIIAAGAMVDFALGALDKLKGKKIVGKVISLSRLDLTDGGRAFANLLEEGALIITDHDATYKCLGAILGRVLTHPGAAINSKAIFLGIRGWGKSARDVSSLYREYTMDTEAIVTEIYKELGKSSSSSLNYYKEIVVKTSRSLGYANEEIPYLVNMFGDAKLINLFKDLKRKLSTTSFSDTSRIPEPVETLFSKISEEIDGKFKRFRVCVCKTCDEELCIPKNLLHINAVYVLSHVVGIRAQVCLSFPFFDMFPNNVNAFCILGIREKGFIFDTKGRQLYFISNPCHENGIYHLSDEDDIPSCYRRIYILDSSQFKVNRTSTPGDLLILSGNYGEAVKHYMRVLRVYGRAVPFLHSNIGVAFYSEQKFEEAEKYFLKEIEVGFERVNVLFFLGLIYIEQNRLAQALDCFVKILSYNPTEPYSHYYIGKIRLKLKQKTSARRSLKACILYAGNDSQYKELVKKAKELISEIKRENHRDIEQKRLRQNNSRLISSPVAGDRLAAAAAPSIEGVFYGSLGSLAREFFINLTGGQLVRSPPFLRLLLSNSSPLTAPFKHSQILLVSSLVKIGKPDNYGFSSPVARQTPKERRKRKYVDFSENVDREATAKTMKEIDSKIVKVLLFSDVGMILCLVLDFMFNGSKVIKHFLVSVRFILNTPAFFIIIFAAAFIEQGIKHIIRKNIPEYKGLWILGEKIGICNIPHPLPFIRKPVSVITVFLAYFFFIRMVLLARYITYALVSFAVLAGIISGIFYEQVFFKRGVLDYIVILPKINYYFLNLGEIVAVGLAIGYWILAIFSFCGGGSSPILRRRRKNSLACSSPLDQRVLIEELQKTLVRDGKVDLASLSETLSTKEIVILSFLHADAVRNQIGDIYPIVDEGNFDGSRFLDTGVVGSREFIHRTGQWHGAFSMIGVCEDNCSNVAMQVRNDGRKGLFLYGHRLAGERWDDAFEREGKEELKEFIFSRQRYYRIGIPFKKVGKRSFNKKPSYNNGVFFYQSINEFNREICWVLLYIVPDRYRQNRFNHINTKENKKLIFMPWEKLITDVHKNPYNYHSSVTQCLFYPDFFKLLMEMELQGNHQELKKILKMSSPLNKYHMFELDLVGFLICLALVIPAVREQILAIIQDEVKLYITLIFSAFVFLSGIRYRPLKEEIGLYIWEGDARLKNFKYFFRSAIFLLIAMDFFILKKGFDYSLVSDLIDVWLVLLPIMFFAGKFLGDCFGGKDNKTTSSPISNNIGNRFVAEYSSQEDFWHSSSVVLIGLWQNNSRLISSPVAGDRLAAAAA
ncbi:MAG: tetratricopeptide repeat protein, partial [Candidatus Omnitrophota bacterium]